MKPYWTGVFPAVTTQLKKDQSLDLPATARHFEALIASGVSGLIVCGSLGENQTLDPDEKRAVVRCGIETARVIAYKPLLDAANHGVLGHGFEPVKSERVQQLYDIVLKLTGVSESSVPKFPTLAL